MKIPVSASRAWVYLEAATALKAEYRNLVSSEYFTRRAPSPTMRHAVFPGPMVGSDVLVTALTKSDFWTSLTAGTPERTTVVGPLVVIAGPGARPPECTVNTGHRTVNVSYVCTANPTTASLAGVTEAPAGTTGCNEAAVDCQTLGWAGFNTHALPWCVDLGLGHIAHSPQCRQCRRPKHEGLLDVASLQRQAIQSDQVSAGARQARGARWKQDRLP